MASCHVSTLSKFSISMDCIFNTKTSEIAKVQNIKAKKGTFFGFLDRTQASKTNSQINFSIEDF